MRRWLAVAAALGGLGVIGLVATGAGSARTVAHAAATCSDYPNQAAAQRAADTRDADGDGIYCESLPCPCLKPGQTGGGGGGGSTGGGGVRCGKERWAVKTLSDSRAGSVNYTARNTTVSALRSLHVPRVGFSTPRLAVEMRTYRVKARLVEYKLEDDSDFHVVIADPNHPARTMIVEFPNPSCVASSIPRAAIRRARNALINACTAAPRHFVRLTGLALVRGVAFVDVKHGQIGIAPNGIELHPVLAFKALTRCNRG